MEKSHRLETFSCCKTENICTVKTQIVLIKNSETVKMFAISVAASALQPPST